MAVNRTQPETANERMFVCMWFAGNIHIKMNQKKKKEKTEAKKKWK